MRVGDGPKCQQEGNLDVLVVEEGVLKMGLPEQRPGPRTREALYDVRSLPVVCNSLFSNTAGTSNTVARQNGSLK